ncbi:hypothetical protein DPMN_185823 [Dreissena polymorpha]|uniref:Uncharacterized protein n=1 Tax=Dreissena polymorpha TaxID=45954 RepID=A0A9D4I7M3_DREPO|nr:hypothetical protein DPMN_185823 [Dreissena polymorpha]
MEIDILFLQFMKSQREANYEIYEECLGKMVPWMFAMDHVRYARWLTVRSQDLILLKERGIDVNEEFTRGHFVTNKTKHRFSALANDQIHEWQNAIVKGDGGFVGLTENPDAL